MAAKNLAGKPPSQRQLRVGEMVRHALTTVLQRGVISDPELEARVISVNEVAMSPDLKLATAYVSALDGRDDKALVNALNANQRYIRGQLSPYLNQMKFMPKIRFSDDTSYDNYARISDLLANPKVKRDLKPSEEGNSE